MKKKKENALVENLHKYKTDEEVQSSMNKVIKDILDNIPWHTKLKVRISMDLQRARYRIKKWIFRRKNII